MRSSIFAAVLFGLMIQSCSIEKRYHSGGFNIQWSNNFSKATSSNTQSNIQKSTVKKSRKDNNELLKGNEITESAQKQWVYATSVAVGDITQPGNLSNISVNTLPKFSKLSNSEISKNSPSFQAIKNLPKIKLQTQANNASRSSNVLLGILLIILAGYFAWNISMLLGLIIFIVAIFVMSSGKERNRNSDNRNSQNNDDKGSTLVDVVYLKNGGILVGSIIEQIPNESLKIQTKDGSVFVYSMNDIARIAKEKR